MADENEVLLLLLLLRRRRKRKKSELEKRKVWVQSIFLKREELGEYHRLIHELRYEDREYFFR